MIGIKNGIARIRTAVQASQTLEDRPGYPTIPLIILREFIMYFIVFNTYDFKCLF